MSQDRGGAPLVLIGAGFAGDGAAAAHVHAVLAGRDGPVGAAWVTALATPRPGHAAFVAVLRPGRPGKPLTLFVNKAPIAGGAHAGLTWGAAQAGVAGGVADAVADGVIAAADAESLLLIAAVWVDPAAADAAGVYANNRAALQAGADGAPSVADVLAARHAPANPFFTPEPR